MEAIKQSLFIVFYFKVIYTVAFKAVSKGFSEPERMRSDEVSVTW